MFNLCRVNSALDEIGEHRLEFCEDVAGVMTWKCLDCGEFVHQWQDNQGC